MAIQCFWVEKGLGVDFTWRECYECVNFVTFEMASWVYHRWIRGEFCFSDIIYLKVKVNSRPATGSVGKAAKASDFDPGPTFTLLLIIITSEVTHTTETPCTRMIDGKVLFALEQKWPTGYRFLNGIENDSQIQAKLHFLSHFCIHF